jgi:hypothetical protein
MENFLALVMLGCGFGALLIAAYLTNGDRSTSF